MEYRTLVGIIKNPLKGRKPHYVKIEENRPDPSKFVKEEISDVKKLNELREKANNLLKVIVRSFDKNSNEELPRDYGDKLYSIIMWTTDINNPENLDELKRLVEKYKENNPNFISNSRTDSILDKVDGMIKNMESNFNIYFESYKRKLTEMDNQTNGGR